MLKKRSKFDELVLIVRKLRGPKGCPWDRVQTHETLKPYMVEEVYEALEAIDSKDSGKLAEELGDILLHIVMHSEMARAKKKFKIDDVISSISAKMIRRHPHVFSKNKVKSIDEVWQKWEEIKRKEVSNSSEKHKGTLESIPQSLPALYRSEKVQRRAARVGFDWDSVANAWEKVYEEQEEIHELLKKSKRPKSIKALKEEIGDLLFAIVNVTRKLDIDAEEALQNATSKFMRRFKQVELMAKKKGKHLHKMKLKEMDKFWDEVKKKEGKQGRLKKTSK
ncbi:nucleoside triphosphate pyrophosphohydrolase [Candidatus Margulisiibacteriota bacterium]